MTFFSGEPNMTAKAIDSWLDVPLKGSSAGEEKVVLVQGRAEARRLPGP